MTFLISLFISVFVVVLSLSPPLSLALSLPHSLILIVSIFELVRRGYQRASPGNSSREKREERARSQH